MPPAAAESTSTEVTKAPPQEAHNLSPIQEILLELQPSPYPTHPYEIVQPQSQELLTTKPTGETTSSYHYDP